MILEILKYPDKRLRTVAKAVENVNSEIKKQVKDMFETMYDAPGIGLAATQVNFHQRLIVVDVSEECNEPICLINPEIIEKNGEIEWEEGCLSVPNYYESVKRANEIKVSALNELGQSFEIEASEMLAVCIQHEMDHLNGILFVDHLSKLKQKRLKKKAEKQTKKL
ncbi:peptide deformylase [Candidatus Pseudothioglobus singularis]|jgi:peptide deformylase|uniref:Peptide deformylase n=1 Tax=Candidatus Pseudothioglobus singularis PS1 TaxID=1125411 RepID=A0A0M4LEB9_9GAMM|nr:peptide deformylase [Candidatus Pseudothioglobus singularis]MDG1166232.1 peptide deformylase [Candidatus Thioglobus sp.]ALE02382.1 peptide deformylase [Candidatus Pseudothioglobus singularis PS1]MDA7441619.1 peptide deformylase [Candidatus Pseudothioglobus singularis]MDB4823000.1 peptide deformylase [Candidatus Pseudothioglobus singularis]MDC1541342.1 peptide deformylase [Candidatus Pseudothioglobus singularis]|tara:strand:+ start:670 stop:1167 length:498 start_codon:yes stop_codon:yes gene_type:complete